MIDATDRHILEALHDDARISLTDLARAVHLGISATRVRVQRLEQQGTITGYTARIDPVALGYPLRATARLSVTGSQDARVFDLLARHPQIVRCVRVTGETCFVLEIVATDMADLEGITSKFAALGEVSTDLVYEVIVDRSIP